MEFSIHSVLWLLAATQQPTGHCLALPWWACCSNPLTTAWHCHDEHAAVTHCPLPGTAMMSMLQQPTVVNFVNCWDLYRLALLYIGCSAKMYPIFVLFISPVKIEIFQVCLFHIIGNFVFHPIFFFLNIY